jgi:hypothetical protein
MFFIIVSLSIKRFHVKKRFSVLMVIFVLPLADRELDLKICNPYISSVNNWSIVFFSANLPQNYHLLRI